MLHLQHLSLATDPDEVLDNLASVERVPTAILPPCSPARLALVWLASSGRDAYCYASGGELTGTWCAWLGDLARVRSDRNGRVPLAEWHDTWRSLLAEMGIALPEGEAHP